MTWQWAMGIASPIVDATKAKYLDNAATALSVKLTATDVAFLEKLYLPHRIVVAINRNLADGVTLLDEKNNANLLH